ncbi:MAG: tail fiber domain-containing protein [Crocinitomicaceae bacterium]
MKKIYLCVLFTLSTNIAFLQAPAGTPGNGQNWRRGGNFAIPGGDNIFGTFFNSPIYTYTNSLARMKLNGSYNLGTQYQIEGYGWGAGVNTSGYLLLGQDGATQQGNPSVFNSKGAFSLLHLNGPQSTLGGGFVQEFGYRPWMQTGITFTGGNDLMYFGIRQTLRGQDKTEMTLTWSDNAGSTYPGPDDMVFRFTSGGNGNTSYSNNLSDPTDLDGVHIARFTGDGNFGLGPTFGDPNVNPNTVRPASLFHMSRDQRKATWMQITNENATNQTANDGFRIGFQGGNNQPGLIRWQEITPLIFQTDWNNGSGGTGNGERMRITTTNFLNTQGQYIGINPGNGNYTRVGISHNGQNPIERPMSLLHLGYDISSGIVGTTADGWRDWMDVGTFTAEGSDNMYVGLKSEGNDRKDAIINWGDNQPATGGDGPDYLRFIFTSTTTSLGGNGDPVATSNDGLEVMRLDPQNGQTYAYNNSGMVGIGDFATNNQNVVDVIDAKLDIDGDLRIRQVLQNDTLNQVLVIDSTDHNRVYWRDISNLSANVQANNGTSLDPNSTDPIVQLGQELVGGTLLYAGDAELLNDREIPLNGHDIVFSSTNNYFTQPGIERIAIGATPPSGPGTPIIPSLPNSFFNSASSKLQVFNATEQTGAHFLTFMDPLNVGFAPNQYSGAKGTVYGTHNDKSIIGLLGQGVSATTGTRVEGVRGEAWGAGNNVGVRGHSLVTMYTSTGGEFTSRSVDGICLDGTSVGVRARATGSNTSNIAFYGEVDNANPCNASENYAAWLNGNVYLNGTLTQASDERLKTNISSIDPQDAMSIIQNLNPVTFEYDNSLESRMMLPAGVQYGFIAQEVEQVLPEIVHTTTLPAERDTLGNETSPEFEFLAMESQDLVPLLFAASKSQINTIDSLEEVVNSQDSIINSLNDRLTNLENCLSNLLPSLCQMNQSLIEQNDLNVQEELSNIINVELSNGENIVLNQNVPNPFAEQTVITYSIPESVGEAIIMFYDSRGVIIKEVKIETRGKGQLNVYGSDLSRGLYSYTLVADGKVIATKKMVKQ